MQYRRYVIGLQQEWVSPFSLLHIHISPYPISVSLPNLNHIYNRQPFQLNSATMDLVKRSNGAIHANGDHFINGATSDIAITTHGSDWYFVRDSHLAWPCRR